MLAEVDRILEALVDLGVDEGFPRERQKLANALFAARVSTDQIAAIGDWAARQRPRSLPGLVKATLGDETRRREVLDDLALMASRRGAAAAAGAPFQPGEAEWKHPAAPDQWDECDRARRIAARVDGDRREIGSVALEFHVSVGDAERLLAMGREMRPRLSAPAQSVEGDLHEARLQRFIGDMAKRKARGGS